MVRQGWALDYEWYSGGAYAAEQLEAEQAERGPWSGSFMAPWVAGASKLMTAWRGQANREARLPTSLEGEWTSSGW